MSKKVTNYVEAQRFESIISEIGLSMAAQAGFVKVQVGGAPAHAPRVYVARTKRVGRVDLSGFTVSDPGVVDLDADLAFGNVRQQLDFSRTPDEILATFRTVLEALATAPVPERPARKAPAPKANAPKGWSVKPAAKGKEAGEGAGEEAAASPTISEAVRLSRKAKIAEAAKRHAPAPAPTTSDLDRIDAIEAKAAGEELPPAHLELG